MKNIDIKITEELAVLSVSGSGYTKEINLVSWSRLAQILHALGLGQRGRGILALHRGEQIFLFLQGRWRKPLSGFWNGNCGASGTGRAGN